MSLLCYTMAMVKKFFVFQCFIWVPCKTQDFFLLKILFIGKSGVTDPYINQIENLIL
jgi:hypothetical protein